MIGITSYGCSTSAGKGVEALWQGIASGKDFSQAQVCRWPEERKTSVKEQLLDHLLISWHEAKDSLAKDQLGRVGVILATTKGFLEDSIWEKDFDRTADLMSPLLTEFCKRAEISPVTSSVVSNACSSSLTAVWLAREWLNSKRVDHAVILAADGVGPFVLKGFSCLHALTTTKARPFASERDGLQLGEAAAVLVLGSNGNFRVSGIGIDSEGYAVTRPSPSGESLRRAINELPGTPDLIIAHGTGTPLNDEVEDRVFFEEFGDTPAVTASKWSIGHTLAASGAIDLILACEAIRRESTFPLGNTDTPDPAFRSRFVTKNSSLTTAVRKVLVSSLGFGGVHAAAMIEKSVE